MRTKIIWTLVFAGCAALLAGAVVLASSLTAAPAPAAQTPAASALQVWEHGKGGRYLQAVTWDLGAAQINPQELDADAALAFSNPPPAGSGAYRAAMLNAELCAQSVQVGAFARAAGYDRLFAQGIREFRAAVAP